MSWLVTAIAHGGLVITYASIAYIIGRGQTIERQWRNNPLATATFAIFLTCAIGHGIHMEHALLREVGIEAEVGDASRLALADTLLVIWTPITLLPAIWYLSMRKRLRILQGGAPLLEDIVQRQAEAQAIHDRVIVGAKAARQHLADGDAAAAKKAVDESLEEAGAIITSLLGPARSVHAVRPGDLRRARGSQ